MAIKEMPLQEKYDRIVDTLLLRTAIDYTLHKELGTVDQWMDRWVQTQIKMLPGRTGIAFKVFRALAPGSAFKRVFDRYLYTTQQINPLSTIEVVHVSDREATVQIRNCEQLTRLKDLVEQAGLDLSPRFMCELDTREIRQLLSEFNIDGTVELEANGCVFSAKFK